MKFGLIPEFIGRLPVITTVAPLDTVSLVRILTEPRNALVKQYQKMFRDRRRRTGVHERRRGGGRRPGARAQHRCPRPAGDSEEVLLPVMFDVPSDAEIARVVVSRDVVLKNVNPTIVRHDDETGRKRTPRKRSA